MKSVIKNLELNDTQILLSLATGNRKTFETLFRIYYSRLCRYAVFLSLTPDEAEDVVQDLFYRLWENRKKISITSSAKGYLFSSVKNSVFNEFKHKAIKHKHSEYVTSVESQITNSDDNLKEELHRKLHSAIQELPEKRREVFTLNKIEGLKYKEIAVKLGISVKTVENQMGEALKFITKRLSGIEVCLLAICIVYTEIVEIVVGVYNKLVVYL